MSDRAPRRRPSDVPGFERRRGEGVPQVVQPHRPETGPGGDPVKRMAQRVRVQVLAVPAVHDELLVVPGGTDKQSALGLFLPVQAEYHDDGGRLTWRRLRSVFGGASPGALRRAGPTRPPAQVP